MRCQEVPGLGPEVLWRVLMLLPAEPRGDDDPLVSIVSRSRR
jgi:hypothetical protein